jgi:aminopeptidase N
MKNGKSYFYLLCISLLASTCFGLPVDFDWKERTIGFELSVPVAGQDTAFFSKGTGRAVKSPAGNWVFSFYLPEGQTDISYALRVKGNVVPGLVNQKNLDIEPVEGEDGTYYLVTPGYFKAGWNALELNLSESAQKSQPGLEEACLFSLRFTEEEAHFGRTFGKRIINAYSQPASDPLQALYDVKHIILNHKISMTSSAITASMTLIGTCLDSTFSFRTVVLDMDGNNGSFSVKSVDRGAGTATLGYNLNLSSNRLYIALPSALGTNSEFTVRVHYAGTPDSSGIFGAPYRRVTHGTPSVPIVYSFSEPYGARQWWPCKDVPDDKFTADLYWTCQTAYYPVSNGLLLDVTTSAGGVHTFHYQEIYPVCSYLISVACTNYQHLYGFYTSQDGLSIMTVGNHIYPENASLEGNGVQGTIEMIDFFAKTFGEYPFVREKYYTATHNSSSSMEHQTATSLGPGLLQPDGRGRTNCHELAHQWFGDGITMKNFDHLWLNEGFASYAETLWVEHKYGTYSYHTYINAWTTLDSYPIVSSSADNFAGTIVYRKGGWVLHMLRKVMGDTAFFQGLKSYMQDTLLRYGNSLTIDFQHHMESALGNNTSLGWFFNEWLYQANRPAYNVTMNQRFEGSGSYFDLSITQTQSNAQYIMPIDIGLTFTNGSSTTITVWNTQYAKQSWSIPLNTTMEITSYSFDPDNWVLDTWERLPVERWKEY